MSLLKSRFIELIGNIQNPKYQLVELNEICEFIKDGTHQTPIYTEDRVNGFKFLSSKDVTSQKINWSNIKYIPKELHEQLYAKLSPKRGDILLAKNGTTGVAAVVDSDEIFDIYVSLALLRPKSGVNVSYLCSALNSEDLKRQFNSSLKGIGVPNLHLREIKKARIIFPPIDIQNKISSITKQIDKSKFLLQQILEKFELLKKSRFIELIGNIQNPKYQLVELNEICEFIKDGTHQTPIYTEDRVNGFKFLSSKDVTSQKINWSNIKYIPKELHEQLYAKLSPKRGDILLAKNGTTGVAAVVDSDEIFDIYVSLALLRPKSGVNVSYLCSALNSEDLKRQFNSSLKGIGVPNLHLREIKKARIIFPPIDIQNKISSITKQIDKSKLIIQKALEDLVGKV